jgi:hypothetical protein
MTWPTPRAAGGQAASASQFPFVARLDASLGNQHETCTATLVGRWWAVTARHCVEGVEPVAIALTFDATSAEETGVPRGVQKVFVDPARQDIALLELDAAVGGVSPVKLANRADTRDWRPGTPVTAVGWGDRGRAARLRSADQLVTDSTELWDRGKLGSAPTPAPGGGWSGHGDSGGPLLHLDARTGRYTQLGVFSTLRGGACYAGFCLPITGNRWGKLGEPAVSTWLETTITVHDAARPASLPVHSHPLGRLPRHYRRVIDFSAPPGHARR